MPAIDLKEVSFSYQALPVISNVNISIDEGEFIGIIGPNGGGKTTLLKLMMGLLTPNEGNVELLGKRPQKRWGEIGYVPQSLPFDRSFPLTLLDLVLEGTLSKTPWYGRYGKKMRTLAMQALDRVGLAPLSNRHFGNLSGGELQRGLIARAIVLEPKLLLLDEPTANVDPDAEAEIYALLKSLNMTIVMVTHNLQVAIHHVKRVLCVQNKVWALKPEEVCEHFAVGLYHPPLLGKK